MARKVFISFRFSDGVDYKEKLVDLFSESAEVINCSEDQDRSGQSDYTIQQYLYKKLKGTSVTIILITPEAVSHKKDWWGHYDDWMYDEIRYSLEDRENNRCNGIIAVYTDEAKDQIMKDSIHKCEVCGEEQMVKTILDIDNLFRKNMMNVLPAYKKNKCKGIYDSDYDSYCSLVSWDDFTQNFEKYIDRAAEKRENVDHYSLVKRLG